MDATATAPAPATPRARRAWHAIRSFPNHLLKAVRRRPVRAIAVLAAVALLVVGTDFLIGYVRFRNHLAAARVETDRWHNATAIGHITACQAFRPEHPEVLLLSARLARRSAAFAEAERLLNACAELHGDSDALVLERLLHRAARGETDEVAAALTARIRTGSGSQARLAREAMALGLAIEFRFGEAHAVLDEWIAETPDDPLALLIRGKLYIEEQRTEPAAAILRRALELDPELDDARIHLASLLVDRRRGDEAVAELSVLRDRLPRHPEVAALWAAALSLQGRTDDARAALDACLVDHPDHARALAQRGTMALQDGDEEGAVRLLRKAVDLDPGNLAARHQFVFALRRNGRAAEADEQGVRIKQLEADSARVTELVRGALRANPNDPNIHHEIGMIALRSGQTREALRWFRSALAADRDHIPTHRVLASIYQQLGNPVLAARHRASAQRPVAPGARP